MRENKLNELSAQEWLRFTKTWFVHNPPPRKKNEVLHPAKYPESMIEGFVRFFTKEGGLVFDPFLGTGSTLVACQNCKRKGVGVELQERYGKIAEERVKDTEQKVIIGDSFEIKKLWKGERFDFLITSPPYGPMLNKKGLASEKREEEGLDVKYSKEEKDLGNIMDYDSFILRLVDLFIEIKDLMKEGAYLVVILQNYREGAEFKTLAWDFTSGMKKHFTLSGVKIWCQDNKTLYPYGYRYSFVPNVHHHYCLIFRKGKNVKEAKEGLVVKIPQEDIKFLKKKAEEKIVMEGWKGRNKKVKVENFFNCFVTEEAFVKLLAKSGKWCRNRGLYVGDAKGAGVDFIVKIKGEEKSIGIRSIGKDSLEKWKRVAYPDDRFREEKEKIADFIVACYHEDGLVRFLGIIKKEKLLEELEKSEILCSKANQERFRVVALNKFNLSGMKGLLEELEAE